MLLGAIPFVNRHLHWNFFVVLPVSGLILGAAFGWLQFRTLRLMHARIRTAGGVFLMVVAGISYVATDAGVWLTSNVTLEDGRAVPLREISSLQEFLGERLTHSSIEARGRTLQVGTTATLVSFVVDEIGALFGAAAVIFGLASSASYCERCSRYRKELRTVEREYPLDQTQASGQWQEFQRLVADKQYTQVAAKMQGMPALTIASRRKIQAKESACPKCGQAALALAVLKKGKDDWVSDGPSLDVESAAHEGPQLVG